jgi:glucokinase
MSEIVFHSLIGDIGGTNARLQLVCFTKSSDVPKVVKTFFYRTRDFESLTHCIQDFLIEFIGTEKYPKNATMAVAGAPYEGRVTLPNTEWPTLDEKQLETELNISPVAFINDFVAVGYSLIKIKSEEIVPVHEAKRVQMSTMIVTGPGTGMGECTLQPSGQHKTDYNVFGTEGGHKNFAPSSKIEWEYLNYVLEENPEIKDKIGYLSTEKAFCGPGIPNIYRFFCKRVNEEARCLTSEEIIQRGLSRADPMCFETLNFFITLYAKEISNFALNSLPYGGIYLVGGLTNCVAEYMMKDPDSPFKTAYFSKGKTINAVLEKFPIYLVKEKESGLLGAFVKAQKDLNDSLL